MMVFFHPCQYNLIGWISILILTTTGVGAQSISFQGRVTDSDNVPLRGSNVILSNTSYGTISDDTGSFYFENVPLGTYTLVVTHVGYKKHVQTINLPLHKTPLLAVVLVEISEALDNVVVTATRTEQAIDEVPMPVQVITREQIDRIGALRLNEVLQEQTGLQMISDHGAGLQMQGLSSDYILILIDGEPIIGRTAGTIDLSRLTANNIEKIEILRGPASSLYGSEAMAGVVNIITKNNALGWSGVLGAQYRSFGTWDANTEAGYRGNRLSTRIFYNRLSSQGYDLTPETLSQTVAPYQAHTLTPKISYRINDQLMFRVSGRYYQEQRQDALEITEDEAVVYLQSKDKLRDWTLLPIVEYHPNDRHQLQLRHYMAGYGTESNLTYQVNDQTYDLNTFDQTFRRSEFQYDWYRNDQHIITGGTGYLTEQVEATRYDDRNQFTSFYVFAQYQWQPAEKWNLVAGGRYDRHSAYTSRLSPKLALGYTPDKWLSLQASVGGGYKAPDFRQLLLAFTNPVAGYSVFGSAVVQEKFAELQTQGQIAQVLIDPATISEIQAESSLAYNLGFTIKPHQKINWRTNLFRNDIQDLIETAPIARKTNGQSVFSYFNLSSVVTQGIETQLDYELYKGLVFSAGYQYLDTRDKEVYRQIKDGKVFRRDAENRSVRVTTSDYGGLFNRSRHSGNAKLFYTYNPCNFDVALRAIYRGRWGLGDFNGNTVLDTDDEYADGYWVINLATHKHIGEWLTLEAGANNLLGKTTSNEPALAGRIFFAGIQVHFTNPNP